MSIFTKSSEANGDSSTDLRREFSSPRPRTGSENSGEISIVGRGVRIEGDIHASGDIRVGGRINGAVFVQSRIVVAPDGVILGGIQSGDGDIAGKVEGDIVASGRLVIRKTASILGQITAENLVVEEGAAISGKCQIGKPTPVEPQKGTTGDGAAEGAPALLPLE